MTTIQLRLAAVTDYPFICEVYNYYVENTTVTFHTGHVAVSEMPEIVEVGNPKYPVFVIEENNEARGYGYFAPYKKRQAYDATAEVTIYLSPGAGGRGIGSFTLNALEQEAAKFGINNLLAVICAENTESVRLFAGKGYEKCAHMRRVGCKFGRELDVVIYQKILSTTF